MDLIAGVGYKKRPGLLPGLIGGGEMHSECLVAIKPN